MIVRIHVHVLQGVLQGDMTTGMMADEEATIDVAHQIVSDEVPEAGRTPQLGLIMGLLPLLLEIVVVLIHNQES